MAGLQDLSISRQKTSVSWAIPVPDNPSQTIYVWFDALTNYITAIGFGNEERERAVGFEKFWPCDPPCGQRHPALSRGLLARISSRRQRWNFLEPSSRTEYIALDPTGRRMSKTLGNAIDLDIIFIAIFQTTSCVTTVCAKWCLGRMESLDMKL